ncbi:MAG: TetR/AcrR family transcriptional regulator [Gammaproteobacteria bacterium]|nr:TetR/AcrR family transcriptional regulator [Gammaproteobacteria bacterium]
MTAITKRKYKSPRQLARQSNIMKTVRTMLEEVGYDGMTIRGLAKRAGVAQGTLYNLYGGKDSLVLAAVDDLLSQLTGTAVEEAPGGGIEAIFARSRLIGAQIESTPRYADAMTRILFHVGPNDPLVDVLFAGSFPFLKSQLEAARQNGEVRPDVDIDLVARHLVGQQWGVVLLWMMGIIPVEDNGRERQRSEIMTLIAIATDKTRKRLQARLAELDGN